MNRVAKLICWLVVAVMTAVASAAIALRWPDIAHHRSGISPFGWRLAFALVFYPLWIAGAVVLSERQLRPRGMRFSAGHIRLTETALVAASLLACGLDIWFAAIFAFKDGALLQVSPQQVAVLLGGVFFAVLGNASAKSAPPVGPAAPNPGLWIRESLRNGWTVTLSGLVMIATAFAPPPARVVVMLVLMPILLLSAFLRRRRLRTDSGSAAPA